MSKLKTLAKIEGMSIEAISERAVFGGIDKGICMNPDCNYTCDTEPDQDKGYCELCKTNTVQSSSILSGII
jgi:hypothetical protein